MKKNNYKNILGIETSCDDTAIGIVTSEKSILSNIVINQNSNLNIERVAGLKIFRKYRKANLVKEFLTSNEVRASFFDHWKSIENIEKNLLSKTKSFCLIHSKEINHPVGSSLNKRVLSYGVV